MWDNNMHLMKFGKKIKASETYRVIAETKGGTNPYFATGAGGIIQSLRIGFGGPDITSNGILQMKTSLPKQWRSITLTGVGPQKKNIYHKIIRICIFSCLKKTAATLLLAIMAFNLVGYRWIFNVIEEKATTRLENNISAGKYSDDQLVEIKIPLNMPYYTDRDYENVYGETDFDGKHYRYVKRKVSNNTLYLLCLPNEEKTSIVKVKNEFAKAVNDIPSDKQGSQQKNELVKLLTTEFSVTETTVSDNIFSSLSLLFINRNSAVADLFIPLTDAQPPEA